MNAAFTTIRHAARTGWLALCLGLPMAMAQAVPLQAPIVPGERVSDWLLRTAGPDADTTALFWTVAAERAPQQRLKQAVLQMLAPTQPLYEWVRALPVTGRLSLARSDARWLQGNPAQDPVLQPGHELRLIPRPAQVTLLSETAQPCVAAHQPGAQLADYLRACWGDAGVRARDWVWVAQSDGRTRRFGVAAWNLEPQDEPAPGAWLWAPSRTAPVTPATSDNLARLLATQPPTTPDLAPDAAAAGRTAPVPVRASAPVLSTQRQPTASDWGVIGLLQTPTARMMPSGDARLHISRVAPYTRSSVMLQPLDWFEVGFRYTDISNRLYGPQDFSGNQSYKDKSIDIKLRLLPESDAVPQLALGLRDIGGTGLFSGEYLVASKRFGNWDASLGLGWGYLGARGHLKNPLSLLGDKFDTRPAPDVGQGGTTQTGSMFRGPTALFGGLQWQPDASPWTFKFELDGNNYQHEPQDNQQTVRSPFNIGAVYAYSPNVDVSLGLERGNTFMLGLTFHGGLNQLHSPKLLDPAPLPVAAGAPAQWAPGGPGNTAAAIEAYTGWLVRSVSHQGASTVVQLETDGAFYLKERTERVVAVLHRDAPASSQRFVLQLQEHGLPMSDVEVNRAEWVSRHLAPEAPSLRLPAQQVQPGQAAVATGDSVYRNPSGLKLSWSPSYHQILGGPDGFLLYQVGVQGGLEHRFTDNTWLTASLNARLIDNFDKFKMTGSGDLPRVRTYANEYATTARLTLPMLQLTHVEQLNRNQYASVYGGMLEPMFGGVGAEWLYRPWQSPLAFGIDVNHVRQRDFRQDLAFRDYAVNTGHATLYWDTGWNDVQVKLSVGQYLAGDKGATLDVKRVFPNGVAIGAWATKTNVPAEQFGEGSFDKGIYATIPFDAMLPKSSPSVANIIWTPLTRDGGARLSRRYPLIDQTKQRDWRAMRWRDARPGQAETAPDASMVLTDPGPNPLQTLGATGVTLGRQVADIPAAGWLWAGGAVLAASLLDNRADDWAVNHQTPRWNRVGTLGKNLPVALALGTGALYTGIAGEDAASTAETALLAGAYTLGASTLTRYAVGRARPADGLGHAHFDGFNSSAVQSGFPSNHVALAFALATPFAQQNNAPWLYGVAGLTALGRIQSREHWLSDTVAAGIMGYGIGTLVGQQRRDAGAPRIAVTPQSIEATWSFK